MSRQILSCGVALLMAVSLAECSRSVTSPTAAVPQAAYFTAQLEGTWTLASIQLAGQARQTRPFDATYTLTFADGVLATRTDCNLCNGTFSVKGSTLTAGPSLACTRAACATAEFESAYTSILNGASETVVTGSTLMLTSARGTLQFVRN